MKITDLIIWILFILSLLIAGWYLFGNSPTFEQAILVFVLTIMFTLAIKINEIGTKLGIFMKRFYSLEDSFKRLASDFKEHNSKK